MSLKIYIFIALSVLVLIGEAFEYNKFIYICKPLLMPSLMLWLYEHSNGQPTEISKKWLLGLAFSTIGDVVLMFAKGPSGPGLFMVGLGAFLIAHLCYIQALWAISGKKLLFLRQKPIIMAFPAIYYVFLMLWILPNIPNSMIGPVMVYGVVICTMLLGVTNLYGFTKMKSFQWLCFGAILFILSDSLIAVNKFVSPIPLSGLLIMSTYIVGQWMLAKGISTTNT
jgi:uncharacterized membrane protein YhhN